MAGGQERVAADLDAFGAGVIGVFLGAGQGGGLFVFEVEAAAEGEDDHLEAGFGALVDGVGDGALVGEAHVHHERVLGGPGGDGAVHAAHGQAAALAVGGLVRQHPGIGRTRRSARGDLLGRAQVGAHLEEAGGLLLVVDLGVEVGIGQPAIGAAIRARRHHAAKGHVGLHMDVGGRAAGGEFVHLGGALDGCEDFAGETVHADGLGRAVAHRQPLAVAGQAVIELVEDRDPDVPGLPAGFRARPGQIQGAEGASLLDAATAPFTRLGFVAVPAPAIGLADPDRQRGLPGILDFKQPDELWRDPARHRRHPRSSILRRDGPADGTAAPCPNRRRRR